MSERVARRPGRPSVGRALAYLLLIALAALMLFPLSFVLGCTTTSTSREEVQKFEPVPHGRVGRQELSSQPAQRATDLLRAAG